jgi:hypothetical protein
MTHQVKHHIILHLPTEYIYVFYKDLKKQRLFPYTLLTDQFCNKKCVHCAVCSESLKIIQINLGLKTLRRAETCCIVVTELLSTLRNIPSFNAT